MIAYFCTYSSSVQTSYLFYFAGLHSSWVYTYVFHRHLSDGSFSIGSEKKTLLLPGIFDEPLKNGDNETWFLSRRADELYETALSSVPSSCVDKLRGRWPRLVIKTSESTLQKVSSLDRVQNLISVLNEKFASNEESPFAFNSVSGFGVLQSKDERILRWFSSALLTHTLKKFSARNAPVLVDLSPTYFEVTLPVGSKARLPEQKFMKVDKFSAFGHLVKLVTLRIPSLGLDQARYSMLSRHGPVLKDEEPKPKEDKDEKTAEKKANTTSVFLKARDLRQGVDVIYRSECINPVLYGTSIYNGTTYRVLGKLEPDIETVKERTGPFAGKRFSRPVANYDECHASAMAVIKNSLEKLRPHLPVESMTDKEEEGVLVVAPHKLKQETELALEVFIRNQTKPKKKVTRPVFVTGGLKALLIERGLTVPYTGGNIVMKTFMDNLNISFKRPNGEQPFASTDMMYAATLLDKLLGLSGGTILISPESVEKMTADWPLAAAFHMYENGL